MRRSSGASISRCTSSRATRGGEVRLAPLRRPQQRHGHGRQPEEAAFDRGRDRARIQHVVAEVLAVVDPGNHHVEFEVEEPGQRDVHAVAGRAGHVPEAAVDLRDLHRQVERQRMAGTTLVAVGRDDGQVRKAIERGTQRQDAARAVPVIVADENLQGGDMSLRGRGRANILKALRRR
jgi:hypothetical protein